MNLTKQEYKVAELLTRGKSRKQVADDLCVSEHTVRNHVANIFVKWDARNVVDVARIFILSIDEPRKFFMTCMLLVIQMCSMMMHSDVPLRRPARTRLRVKTEKSI